MTNGKRVKYRVKVEVVLEVETTYSLDGAKDEIESWYLYGDGDYIAFTSRRLTSVRPGRPGSPSPVL